MLYSLAGHESVLGFERHNCSSVFRGKLHEKLTSELTLRYTLNLSCDFNTMLDTTRLPCCKTYHFNQPVELIQIMLSFEEVEPQFNSPSRSRKSCLMILTERLKMSRTFD